MRAKLRKLLASNYSALVSIFKYFSAGHHVTDAVGFFTLDRYASARHRYFASVRHPTLPARTFARTHMLVRAAGTASPRSATCVRCARCARTRMRCRSTT